MVKGQPRKSTALFHVYGQKGATPMTKRTKYSMLLCNAKRTLFMQPGNENVALPRQNNAS